MITVSKLAGAWRHAKESVFWSGADAPPSSTPYRVIMAVEKLSLLENSYTSPTEHFQINPQSIYEI